MKELTQETIGENEPWQIATARYCVEHSEEGFSQEDIRNFVNKYYSVKEGHIQQFIEEEIQNPPGRQYSRSARGPQDKQNWTAPLELVAKVTDYDELREARKNASNAWRLSLIAIIITSIGVVVQALEYFIQ